jgi:hypothetical protein
VNHTRPRVECLFVRLAGAVGFRRWWRVTLTWQSGMYSPTGHREQVIEVHTVAGLRATVLTARADPRVESYGYRLAREWSTAVRYRGAGGGTGRCPHDPQAGTYYW